MQSSLLLLLLLLLGTLLVFGEEPVEEPTDAPITAAPVTAAPTTRSPTVKPTRTPTLTPTTKSPSAPTERPTVKPTTLKPTRTPTTGRPTSSPTPPTTRSPTFLPTTRPTSSPTPPTTRSPTLEPTFKPTRSPTFLPTLSPDSTQYPSAAPTFPTRVPTSKPSRSPSMPTTQRPTLSPTARPSSLYPTRYPTFTPTGTMAPTTSLVAGVTRDLAVRHDVSALAALSLDLQQIDMMVGNGHVDFKSARTMFTTGRRARSMQSIGLDLVATTKFQVMFTNYYGSNQFGTEYVLSGINATGLFTNRSKAVRAEAAQSGLFWVALPAVVNKLSQAVAECESNEVNRDSPGVLAAEQAWAYYAGVPTGSSLFQLAQTLATEFAPNGSTTPNTEITSLVQQLNLVSQRESGPTCASSRSTTDLILFQINLILVQCLIKVLYDWHQSSTSSARRVLSGSSSGSEPEIVHENLDEDYPEAYEYLAVKQVAGFNAVGMLLPQIHKCNPQAARELYLALFPSGTTDLVQAASKAMGLIATLQSVYSCLGVVCQQVGGTANVPVCQTAGADPAAPVQPALVNLQGLALHNDVTSQAKIDGDVEDMVLAHNSFATAKAAFLSGGSSIMATRRQLSQVRTLASLCEPAEFQGEPTWEAFKKFHASETFGRDFVLNALDGTGFAANQPDEFRQHAAITGTQYLVLWQYVVHKLTQAVSNTCTNGTASSSSGLLLDEAWAYHTGASANYLLFSSNAEQCLILGSCDSQSRSPVNNRLAVLFAQAQTQLGNCAELTKTAQAIKAQMTIGAVQGALLTQSPAGANWAYAYALMPMLSSSAAQTARANLDKSTFPVLPVATMELELPGLGLTCRDVVQTSQTQTCLTADTKVEEEQAAQEQLAAETRTVMESWQTRAVVLPVVLSLSYLLSLLGVYALARRHFFLATLVGVHNPACEPSHHSLLAHSQA
ncbi:hypothetical protein BASA81_013283 [Batrachochytrium salamandrivorans]|nr:hypothetical protein BASA81_013283 [Batrachochytrium salamandrivorans]